MTETGLLTSQDWYRVRRGEDEVAWGKTYVDPQLPCVLFSRRSFQELAFLRAEQQQSVRECIRQMTVSPLGERDIVVLNGGGRRLAHAGGLRIVFRFNADRAKFEISTIRGGEVLDPENVGPPPASAPTKDD
ncbi:MAG: hypothetical protein KJ964_12930 [Verrucomicrobia bacterium]|nr:hypothetical protein [Verrucomicrobiota bacterium]MBU1734414.1 hypothetical protein [Verrucomicrobiota bacterium]MBU1857320.1 hypothetical protein [Verrucomicrobiota bacterium]